MEFYMGRTLTNTMINLGFRDVCANALYQVPILIESVMHQMANGCCADGSSS